MAEDTDEQLYVITHIDFVPPQADAGRELIEGFAKALRSDPGLIRCDILQQVFRKNHYEFVLVWRDDAAYAAHLSAPATRAFRDALHPMIGAPFDDRQHRIIDIIN
jgi:quinol monooxygenase YgiN